MSVSSHFLPFFLFLTLFFVSQAVVPPSQTFKYVINGEFGEYITEYDASYRLINVPNFATGRLPFQLFFYNTTPDAYVFGLRMGRPRYESQLRWVWDANRANPVRENGTLTFAADGNLVLADVNGRVAWQTGTSNKGVAGIELLRNGNLVLKDKQGRFVWQSFEHPTDTLLVGSALTRGGRNKLVSRVSDVDGSDGPYSLVLERDRLAMYLKSKNSPKPLLYYVTQLQSKSNSPISRVVFNNKPLTEEAYEYELEYIVYNVNSSDGNTQFIGRPTKFNSTLSILRVGLDGSLKVYSFYDRVQLGGWEVTFSAFDRDDLYGVSECRLPTKCGSLGVCEDNECVACPTPKGLLGWSKNCALPKLPSCKPGSQVVNYFKVVGVEHFTYEYTQGEGPIKLADCRAKCSKDCGCLGFFYREESSKCLVVPEVGTLSKVSNQTHVAYIKMSK
ncbi:hypothetical protein AQUCO_08400050v1 [Aquilegia coerulea]|uniref:Bulb-type lectin domain-containing protein n=1 Tax=Aquilegia coerulea TaxID=218851 RepID=A0A2G5C6V9_AQUCA|nr:hypothetical protein AQUCO_08400050v1 [Aquilegia coerulea]